MSDRTNFDSGRHRIGVAGGTVVEDDDIVPLADHQPGDHGADVAERVNDRRPALGMIGQVNAWRTHPSSGPGRTPGGRPEWVVAALRAAGCVFAEEEATILVAAAAHPDQLAPMVRRRVDGTPLEYIVGWVEFAGRRIGVDPGVFVPRRRSELLVRAAVAHLGSRPVPVVVDLCCGCGAIGLVIGTEVAGAQVHAADIDPVAVRCARRNLAAVGGNAYQGDLFGPLPRELRGQVQLLVANAPYVPTEAIAMMPPEARDHEPTLALDGGDEGTDILRRLIAGAPGWLADDGILVVELGESQIARISDALVQAGLAARIVRDDELGGTAAIGRPTGITGGGRG